jgi:hypothetical protein
MGLVLSPLTMLHTLIIELGSYGSEQEPDLWIKLLGMLETVSSLCLERAVIIPNSPTPAFASSIDWQALRATCEVVPERLPRLRVVLGVQSSAPFPSILWDILSTECERIISEAIVANGLEEMVSTERIRMGQWDE